MNFCRSFRLAALFALFSGGSISGALADGFTMQPKQSEGEFWSKIVAAREALNQALAVDTTVLSAENLAVARKRASDQAIQLERTATDFSNKFVHSTNLLRAYEHGAYALGIGEVLERQTLLAGVVDHVAGVEWQSQLAKDTPALSTQADMLRGIIETNLVVGAIDALRFPTTNSTVYLTLIRFGEKANSEAGRFLLRHLLTNSLLSPVMAGYAKSILNRQFSIGQPLDIKFTAMDGRKVDLANMRGKVVLVNFWATTCASCMAELPELKSIYQQYRNRGFEIVGVSLVDETKLVEKVIKAREIRWPNSVNEGGWNNGFAGKCGVFAIPNGWLVDKKGILREVAVRERLKEKVELLLTEPP